jgi:hypothetical protein
MAPARKVESYPPEMTRVPRGQRAVALAAEPVGPRTSFEALAVVIAAGFAATAAAGEATAATKQAAPAASARVEGTIGSGRWVAVIGNLAGSR